MKIHRAFALSVIGLLALMVACFSVADQSPATADPASTAVPLREFRIFVEPRNCATYILDPQPVEGSKYIHGTGVTISLVPAEGCSVNEWINVDSFSGLTGRVNMNADRIVQINFERTGVTVTTPPVLPTPFTGPTETPAPLDPRKDVVDGPINFSDFSSIAGLRLLGDAAQFQNLLRIIPAEEDSIGAFWYSQAQFIRNGFQTTFRFKITSENRTCAGRGFAFVVQNFHLDAYGNTLGYSSIPDAVAVEFDLSRDVWTLDPDDNHVGVRASRNGLKPEEEFSLGTASPKAKMSDGAVHTARIIYVPDTLQVFVDDLERPVLSIALDIENEIVLTAGNAWVGITAQNSGGSCAADYDILDWSFDSLDAPPVVEPTPTSIPPPTSPPPTSTSTPRPTPTKVPLLTGKPGGDIKMTAYADVRDWDPLGSSSLSSVNAYRRYRQGGL